MCDPFAGVGTVLGVEGERMGNETGDSDGDAAGATASALPDLEIEWRADTAGALVSRFIFGDGSVEPANTGGVAVDSTWAGDTKGLDAPTDGGVNNCTGAKVSSTGAFSLF